MKKIIFLIFFLATITNINAIIIHENTTLKTSNSNSSILFDIPINTTNITIHENYIFIFEATLKNSTGTYFCGNINHSTINLEIKSSNFTCNFSNSEDETKSQESNGRKYYLTELSEYSNRDYIEFKIRTKPNETKEIIVSDPKNTEVSKIELKSKNLIYGKISISEIKLPKEIKNIYKKLEINSTIDSKYLEEVSIYIKINNSWIEKNNISKINAIKETAEEIKTSLIYKNKDFSTYKFTSKNFSIWTIYGETITQTTENNATISTKQEIKDTKKSPEIQQIETITTTKNKLHLYLIIILILLIILILVNYSKKKRKKHSKKLIKKKFLIVS